MNERKYWIIGYTLPGDTDWQVFDTDAHGSFSAGRHHQELNTDPNLKNARIFAFTMTIDEHVDETDEAENAWINENVWELIPDPPEQVQVFDFRSEGVGLVLRVDGELPSDPRSMVANLRSDHPHDSALFVESIELAEGVTADLFVYGDELSRSPNFFHRSTEVDTA